jgi:glutamate-1-semialdehyde 2,1-aminomutase
MEKARKLIPGGTNSGARSTITRGLYEGFKVSMPAFMERGKGSHLFDADGNEWVDYIMAFGPIILGHAHPAVVAAVREQIERGTVFAANTELELELSEKLVQHIPSAEQVLITNTGSDADSIALRIARAYTGRQKVLKFEGHYHGWHDWDMVGNTAAVVGTFAKGLGQRTLMADGVAESILNDAIVLPWNDPELLEKTLKAHGHEIAAVFTEGYQSNFGVMPPEKGYLELMRKLTKDYGIVFVMDEVITGFRMGLGGAQKHWGITPDMSTFSKAMANGFTVAAVVGSRALMDPVATDRIYIAGTFNGSSVSAAASLATIKELESHGTYKQLYDRGQTVMKGIQDAFTDNHIPGIVQGPGPMWSVFFTDKDKIAFTREVYAMPQHPHIRRSAIFFQELVNRGVLVSPARYGRMYFSFAHTKEDVDRTIDACQAAIKETRQIK